MKKIMNNFAKTCGEYANLATVSDLMFSGGGTLISVIGSDHQIKGTVSFNDVGRAIATWRRPANRISVDEVLLEKERCEDNKVRKKGGRSMKLYLSLLVLASALVWAFATNTLDQSLDAQSVMKTLTRRRSLNTSPTLH